MINGKGAKALILWKKAEKTSALAEALRLLEGIGEGRTFIANGKRALHVRRALTSQELLLLPTSFLECPAVDLPGLERQA